MVDLDDLICPIVGFEFTGDELLEGDFLPLRQGLTVAYGLNGAGKTRLLRGIRAALTGVRDDVDLALIISIPEPSSRPRWGEAGAPTEPLAVTIARSLVAAGFSSSDVPTDPHDPVRIQEAQAFAVIDEYIGDLAGDEDADLLTELRESRLFLLLPTGTVDHPSWDAWAVADLSQPGAVRVMREVAEAEQRYEEYEAQDEDDEAKAFNEYMTEAGSHALFSEWTPRPHARRRARGVQPRTFDVYARFKTDPEDLSGFEVTGVVNFGLAFLNLEQDPQPPTMQLLSRVSDALDDMHRTESLDMFQRLTDAFRSDGGHRRMPGDPVADELTQQIEESVTALARELSERAQSFLRKALPDAPAVQLHITPPSLRFRLPAARWMFGHQQLCLEDLSRAERQWARRAINYALESMRIERIHRDKPTPLKLLLIDEPEAALHRAAEAQMAELLGEFATDPQHCVIVASHSPELLDAPDANLVEIRRNSPDPRRSTVRPLALHDRDALVRLGLTPSDLLRWQRVIVLVEGVHDKTLLDVFAGSRLRAARAGILPMHGGIQLPHTIESQVLFTHTRAHVVAIVDNQRAELLTDVWARALDAAVLGDLAAAKDLVVKGIPDRKLSGGKKDSESSWLRSWLTTALDAGLEGRVTPLAFPARDIVEYLPVHRLVENATSWEELHAEHERAKQTRSGTANDFKRWLELTKRADFSEASLRRAAEGLKMPKDFEPVISAIEARGAAQPS